MNYRTTIPRKFNGIRYKEGDMIPENEFKDFPDLCKKFLDDGTIVKTDDYLRGEEGYEFNQKVKAAEEKSAIVPNLRNMEWREAVEAVLDIKSSQTLLKLQTQENHRESGARKSVIRAIERQLRLYS